MLNQNSAKAPQATTRGRCVQHSHVGRCEEKEVILNETKAMNKAPATPMPDIGMSEVSEQADPRKRIGWSDNVGKRRSKISTQSEDTISVEVPPIVSQPTKRQT